MDTKLAGWLICSVLPASYAHSCCKAAHTSDYAILLPCRMEDLQKRLNDLLQGTARKGLKLSVTPCVLAELKGLGADFQGL